MTSNSDERDWFTSATGKRVTAVEMAEILNVSRNSVNTRLKRGLDADEIIVISRGLGLSPIHALVELGKLTDNEVMDFLDGDGTLLVSASVDELIYQLADESLSVADKIALGAAAKALSEKRDARNKKMRSVATSTDTNDGTVKEFSYDAGEYAADNSVDEDEARLEGGEDLID